MFTSIFRACQVCAVYIYYILVYIAYMGCIYMYV